MNKGFIEITDRPDLYDWQYQDYQEDINLYHKLSNGHDVILECGIGTGRVALPLARLGKQVYGIDNSQAMLKSLQNKLINLPNLERDRVHAHYADMRDFDLRRQFPFIYLPFSTFNYLLTIDDQKSCLARIRNHLIPHGTLVLEVISFSLFPNWLNNDCLAQKILERTNLETGKTMEMWRVIRFDSATQIVEQDRYFKVYDQNRLLESEIKVLWRNRFFLMGELQILLRDHGFEITNIYGNCNFGPYNHTSNFAVVVANLK